MDLIEITKGVDQGVDIAERFIAELEGEFSWMDEDAMVCMAASVLATALDCLSIKHGRDPEHMRELIVKIGKYADAAAEMEGMAW